MREKEESEGWVGWVLGHGLEFFIFYFLKMFGRFGRYPKKIKKTITHQNAKILNPQSVSIQMGARDQAGRVWVGNCTPIIGMAAVIIEHLYFVIFKYENEFLYFRTENTI
jgi:hypothetical protein